MCKLSAVPSLLEQCEAQPIDAERHGNVAPTMFLIFSAYLIPPTGNLLNLLDLHESISCTQLAQIFRAIVGDYWYIAPLILSRGWGDGLAEWLEGDSRGDYLPNYLAC